MPQQGYVPGGMGGPYGGPPFAGFGARLGARLIDSLITAIIPGIAFLVLVVGPHKPRRLCTVNGKLGTCRPPSAISWTLFGLLITVGVLFALYYFIFLVGRTGQTIGRKVLGIKVVDKHNGQPIGAGRAFVRFIMGFVSSSACLLGYLWMLWDEEKQTWHDKVADSYVINV